MDEQLELTMLFDFYGDLLPNKQREYFRLHHMEDLSLSEIAENEGVSRQAVWENIRRAEEALRKNEERIALLSRYRQQQRTARELERDTQELLTLTTGRARVLAENIRRRVKELQHGI